MSDLIDRQKAIDIVYRQRFGLQKLSFDIIMEKLSELPSAETEPHYCRECKWSWCYINVGKHGETETYWRCLNWDGETDEEGYCHEWERRTDATN